MTNDKSDEERRVLIHYHAKQLKQWIGSHPGMASKEFLAFHAARALKLINELGDE